MKKILALIAVCWVAVHDGSAQAPLNSLDFDGAGDYVTTALPAIFTDIAGNDFTVEAWVKTEGSGTQRIFFAQADLTHFVSILLNASNTPYIYIYCGTAYGMNSSSSLAASQWTHIAVTWDASAMQIQMYIDGVLQTLVSGGSSSNAVDNVMAIGSKTDGTQNLIGELDEFRIWNYVRSACQITASMNSEFTVSQPGLLSYYNFNQGTAGGNNAGITSLPDFCGAYNGTLHNFSLSGSASNWMSSGAVIFSANQSGNVNTSVTLNINTLTANTAGASYQWLDCNNSYAVIPGQTGQSFTPAANGSYAVAVTQGGCADTSSCIPVTLVGIPHQETESIYKAYPNPAVNAVTVDLGKQYGEVLACIFDSYGRKVKETGFRQADKLNITLPASSGPYCIVISGPELNTSVIRVVKR